MRRPNLRARWGTPSHSLRLRQGMLRKSSITRRTSKSSRSSFRLDFPRRRPSESKAETRMKPVLVKITVGGVLAELNGVSELETSFIDRRGGRLKGTTTMKAEEDRALRNALLRRSLVGERKRDEGANNKRGRTLQTIADEGKLRFMLIEDEIMDRSTVGKGIRSRVWLSRSWSLVPTGLPSKTSCLAILGMRMHGLIYARRMVGMNRTNCTFHNWEISETMKPVDSTYFPPDEQRSSSHARSENFISLLARSSC